MTYVVVTSPEDLDKMSGYVGTTLIHTEEAFLVWLWVNPNPSDLQAEQLIALAAINLT